MALSVQKVILTAAELGMDPTSIRKGHAQTMPRPCFTLSGFILNVEVGEGRWNHYIAADSKTAEFKWAVTILRKALWSSRVAQQVKDSVLSLQHLDLLLWAGFDPALGTSTCPGLSQKNKINFLF